MSGHNPGTACEEVVGSSGEFAVMFRNLFKRKPRLGAADPEQRIAALGMLPANAQEDFARLYREDADEGVRAAALERLTNTELLAALLEEPDRAEQAASRMLSLVDDKTPDSVRSHPRLLRAVLHRADQAEDAVAAAERIADLAARADAVARHPQSAMRLAVLEATWDPAALGEFEKAARDKGLRQAAKERLGQFRKARAVRESEDASTEKLLGAVAKLRDDDPHYDARRDLLERDWATHIDAVASTDSTLSSFGVVARDVEALRRRFPPRRQPPKPVERDTGADFAPLLAEAEALRDSVAKLIADDLAEAGMSELKSASEALAGKWNATADSKPPDEAMSAGFRAAMATLAEHTQCAETALSLANAATELLDQPVPGNDMPPDVQRRSIERQTKAIAQLLGRYRWPESLPRPKAMLSLSEREQALAAAATACAQRIESLAEEVAAALAAVRESVERGAAHEAVERDRRLRDLVKDLPKTAVQPVASDLADVGARVRELRDWRAYAETPRRQALCEEMEKLAETPLEVHEQAEAVKGLRSDWNALGTPDTRRDRELKRQFDRAAERAFEPCRSYFKEQAKQRAFNLEQRGTIVAALEDFLEHNDWQHADWRGVDKVLRQARAEWRQFHPVDRKAGRELATRFDGLAEQIHGLLKEEWDRNLAQKSQIVEEAASVRGSSAPATDKAESMKALQRRWKSVGPVPRRADQRLWKHFRAECDAVFGARDEVHERRHQRRRTVEDAQALIAELERRVDIDPGLDRYTIADYQRRLDDLGELPKDIQRQAEEALREADRVAVQRQSQRES